MNHDQFPLLADQPLARQLFERTFQHPLLAQYIEWVPTRWLQAIANPHPSDTTCLGTWEPDAPRVSLDVLYRNMLEHGMRDPLIVGIGRVSRTARLEAGNHRLKVLAEQGFKHVPAVAYVGDQAVTQAGNGTHEGRVVCLKLPAEEGLLGPYPIKEYRRLSDVLVRLPS